jgi:hypothetical protein
MILECDINATSGSRGMQYHAKKTRIAIFGIYKLIFKITFLVILGMIVVY